MTIIHPVDLTGHSIFCDDYRDEIGNKISCMGMYTNHRMTVYSALPTRLIQLCVLTTLLLDPRDEPTTVVYRILMEPETLGEDKLLHEREANVPAFDHELLPTVRTRETDAKSFTAHRNHVRFPGLEVTGPCRIKARAFVGDDEIRCGSLIISSAPEEKFAERFGVPRTEK
jgi:hypothetical protein